MLTSPTPLPAPITTCAIVACVVNADAAATGRRARRPRVLVVDDEHCCRAAMRRELMRLGYDVQLAASGAEALELFPSSGADVVLTDLLMARMGGLQLIRMLRARWPDEPVIAVTGGTLPDVATCRRLDAEGITLLAKPFGEAELAAALHRALGGEHGTPRI